MNEKLKEILTPYKIAYQAFCDYYTPERVDLVLNNNLESIENRINNGQSFALNPIFILIKFPEVTITNEQGESRVIYDLIVRVDIGANAIAIKGNRFSYTYEEAQEWELLSDTISYCYKHSHLPYSGTQFDNFCLGSGPLSHTVRNYTLRSNNPKEYFGLLAYEISKYVTVESLIGRPYIKLSSRKTHFMDPNKTTTGPLSKDEKILIEKYLSTFKDTICWNGSNVFIGLSFPDFHAALSNINNTLEKPFRKCKGYYNNGLFYTDFIDRILNKDIDIQKALDNTNKDNFCKDYLGNRLQFKGKPLEYKIINASTAQKVNYYDFIAMDIAKRVYTNLLLQLNTKYHKLWMLQLNQQQ